ncbi:MAG: class I SAM-dependent methyltransferase [Tannerella sp.]|jgi:hypothetical protein|nr:class I SAM-dependent methyltransferase [Tannerella sp.]
MQINESLKKIIAEHLNDDVNQLILNHSRFKNIDIKFAAQQIEARKIIKHKLPDWRKNYNLIFPSTLAAEQCSSQRTALYKQRFVNRNDTIYDMTGGLGVDAFYFSQKAEKVVYMEHNKHYCEAAINNFHALNVDNIDILNICCTQLLKPHSPPPALHPQSSPQKPVLYIDPSRRKDNNKRVYDLKDCEPDLTDIWTDLQKISSKIIVKLSPMIDITHVVRQLSGIVEIHIVSIRNDCKEIIVIAEQSSNRTIKISCINCLHDDTEETFVFTPDKEKTASVHFASDVKKYLCEPNASVLKAGAYKYVAAHFNIEKLHPGCHLYTSDRLIEHFPGRIFETLEIYPFNNHTCKTLSKSITNANITVRNFPLSAEELRKKLKINDGGDIYLFAGIMSDDKKILIQCRKKSDAAGNSAASVHSASRIANPQGDVLLVTNR